VSSFCFDESLLVICRSLISNSQVLTVNSKRALLAPIIVKKVLDTVGTIKEEAQSSRWLIMLLPKHAILEITLPSQFK